MFTSRGYRQYSKENKKYSRQGQIIQRKPVFQIDNNPVVLDAYKKFILDTLPKPLLKPKINKDSATVILSDYDLSWNQSNSLSDIYSDLLAFAGKIFISYQNQSKSPVSLVLYSPNVDDTKGWAIMAPLDQGTVQLWEKINSIIIDTQGNLSFTQYGHHDYAYARQIHSINDTWGTLGYGNFSGTGNPTYGSPLSMKMDVYYLNYLQR